MAPIDKPPHILVNNIFDCAVAQAAEQLPGSYINTPAVLPLSPSTVIEYGYLADNNHVTVTVMLTVDQAEFMTNWNNSPDGPVTMLSQRILGEIQTTEVTWKILGVSSTNHDDFVLLVTLSVT